MRRRSLREGHGTLDKWKEERGGGCLKQATRRRRPLPLPSVSPHQNLRHLLPSWEHIRREAGGPPAPQTNLGKEDLALESGRLSLRGGPAGARRTWLAAGHFRQLMASGGIWSHYRHGAHHRHSCLVGEGHCQGEGSYIGENRRALGGIL